MILGIVGSEAAKFTPQTEQVARRIIYDNICALQASKIVSGACHLGGIDEWAIEEAIALERETENFPPKILAWEGGYKQRNIQIAEAADVVLCITLKELPATYTGMRFKWCYHCKTKDHVKSGGCWTMNYAKKIGKKGQLIVIG